MVHAGYNDMAAFHAKLARSKRILAVCGAGLSAASGLPTFRGAGGYWRNHQATDLATPGAFERDPGLVWLFYAYRRHMALKAKPNAGHYALAALAEKNPNFLCLSQNVDGLHLRANHPLSQLKLLHGSLFNIKCSNEEGCGWTQPGTNTDDPFCPALAAASVDPPSNNPAAPLIPLLDPSNTSIAKVSPSDLPRCPQCKTGLQRPGVVWFGENLDEEMLQEIDDWIFGKDGGRSNIQDWLSGKSKGPGGDPVDMVLVIGTSALVYPAAGYAEAARTKGHTSVVTVNLDAELPENLVGMKEGDFAFGGSADEILPRLLEPVIGRVVVPE